MPLAATLARRVHRAGARALIAGGTPGQAFDAALRESRRWLRLGPRLYRTLHHAAVQVLFLAGRAVSGFFFILFTK